MPQFLVTGLLWFAIIGCGLMAGVYFAFSTFVMSAFGRLDPAAGMAAMNAVNTVILRSLFMPLFFGTTLAALALAIAGPLRWSTPGAMAMTVGGIIYVLGMFVVTVALNVPLNDGLAAASGSEAAAIWMRYMRDWTLWNHVRTVASVIACCLFVAALTAT